MRNKTKLSARGAYSPVRETDSKQVEPIKHTGYVIVICT